MLPRGGDRIDASVQVEDVYDASATGEQPTQSWATGFLGDRRVMGHLVVMGGAFHGAISQELAESLVRSIWCGPVDRAAVWIVPVVDDTGQLLDTGSGTIR